MKVISTFIICLLLIIAPSCKQGAPNADVIVITYNTGDREGHVFIGTSETSISESYKQDQSLKKSTINNGMAICVVESKALNHISKYVKGHCVSTLKRDFNSHSVFLVRTYSGDNIHKCYYAYDDKIISYFEGMIKWINESPYKDECRELLKHLQLYVDNRKAAKE